jgi:hypothetical protein
MTFRTLCAALAVALALPAAAQDDLTLDLSSPKAPPKDAKKAKGSGSAAKDDLGLDLTPTPKAAKGSGAAAKGSGSAAKDAAAAKAATPAAAKPPAPAAAPAATAKTSPAPAAGSPAVAKPAGAPAATSPSAAPPATAGAKPAAGAPAAAPPAASAPSGAPAAGTAAKPAAPVKGAPDLAGVNLELDTRPISASKDLDLMDVPNFDDLDLKILKDVSLCIFPFIKEDKLNEGGQLGGAAAKAGKNLENIQRIFSDVAKSSTVLKDAIVLGKDSPTCGIEDTTCIANIGRFTGCAAVLAGRSTREDNGFTLRARMVNAKTGKLMGKVNQVMATDDDNQVAAWAEGQACRALKVDCKATVTLDADRPDMRVLLDNKPLERKPSPTAISPPETLTLGPGVYKLRVMIGQRNSREEVLAVRRGAVETVYARQLKDGGIPLMVASAMQKGVVPPKSVDVEGGKWTKPVGYVLAGLGVAAVGFGGYEYMHATSLVNDANTAYDANGGFLKQGDLDKVSQAKSANSTSKIAFAVGAGLVAVGAVMLFAF